MEVFAPTVSLHSRPYINLSFARTLQKIHRRKSATLFGCDFTIHESSEKGLVSQDKRRRNSFIVSETSLLTKASSPNSDSSFGWIDDCCRELKDQLMVLSVGGGNDSILNSVIGDRRRRSTETEGNAEVHGQFSDSSGQLTRTLSSAPARALY
jgi:hypothetical protein